MQWHPFMMKLEFWNEQYCFAKILCTSWQSFFWSSIFKSSLLGVISFIISIKICNKKMCSGFRKSPQINLSNLWDYIQFQINLANDAKYCNTKPTFSLSCQKIMFCTWANQFWYFHKDHNFYCILVMINVTQTDV